MKYISENSIWAKETVRLWNLSDKKWDEQCFKHRPGLASYYHKLVRNGRATWEQAYKEAKVCLTYSKVI